MKPIRRAAPVLAAAERLAARWGLLVVLGVAACYYAAYFNHGLNLGGEGGTAAVIAMRLNEGQRPIADTFLGYNVLWFYPIAWLFQVTGPDYLVLRGYFFAICALAAVLGFLTVRRVTGSGLLALALAVVLVLIPGMLFRNYMGLLAVANQLVLVAAFVLPVRRAAWRVLMVALSGAVLGLTFLVRVEVGWLTAVIWVGLLVLLLIAPGEPWGVRWRGAVLGGLFGLLAFGAVHAPFLSDAVRRGFAAEFVSQYTSFLGLLGWELTNQFAPRPAPLPAAAAPDAGALAAPASEAPSVSDGRRQRPPPAEIFTGRRSRHRYFAAAIYLPVGFAVALTCVGAAGLAAAGWRRDAGRWRDALSVLVLTGCALTLFPQYFFFRPDTPHVTEFMVPFLVAMTCAAGVAVRRAVATRGRLDGSVAGAACLALVVMAWVHFGHAWPKESAGTIAARKPAAVEFVASNNVRVWVPLERAEGLSRLHETIQAHAGPAEYVVCLPYSPTINFLADRPSYLWDLYTDNTMAEPAFDAWRIAELGKFDPAVIVIDHRPINNSEASRFRNWAPTFYAYVRQHYDFAGEFAENEVFVRRGGRR